MIQPRDCAKASSQPDRGASQPWLDVLSVCFLAIVLSLSFQIRHHGFAIEHPETFDESLYAWLAYHTKQEPSDYSGQGLYDLAIEQGHTFPKPTEKYLTRPLFKHPPTFIQLLKMTIPPDGSLKYITLIPPLMGGIIMLVSFLLVKKAFGALPAYLVGFFLCLDPNLWITSQKMWMETTLTAFMMGGVFFFCMAVDAPEDKKKYWFLATGLATGLAITTKYVGLLILPGFLIYATLYERDLLRNIWFWSIPIVTCLILTPWVYRNVQVYGSNPADLTIFEILSIWSPYAQKVVTYFVWGLGALVVAALLLALWVKKKDRVKTSPPESRDRGFRLLPYVYGTLGILFLLCLVLQPAFQKSLVRMMSLNIIPTSSFLVGFFRNEPWSFYFGRFLELSPFYLFGYLIFFLPLLDRSAFNKTDLALIPQATLILLMLSLWRNYQCRYALLATTLLLIFSSRVLAISWNQFGRLRHKKGATVMRIAWIFIALAATIKTILIDIRFVMPNDMAYY